MFKFGLNSYIFANGVEIYKFKTKDSVINATPSCLGNVSKYFSVHNMKKTGFYGDTYRYDILHLHQYLMKKHDIKL